MKIFSTLWLSLFLILAAGCTPAATVDVEAEQALLMQLDKEVSDAIPDIDKIVSFMADDIIYLPAGADRVDGKEGVRAFWESMVAMPGFALSWTPTEAVVAASGDIGYVIGAAELTRNDSEGNPVTITGKYIAHWEKQADGSWKLVADIFNFDGPPPAE